MRASLRPVSYLHISVLRSVLPTPVLEAPTAALFAPPSFAWSLWTVPETMTRELAGLTSIQFVADEWLQAMHSDPNLDPEDLEPVDWTTALSKISELARLAISGDEGLFLYDGPKPHE